MIDCSLYKLISVLVVKVKYEHINTSGMQTHNPN